MVGYWSERASQSARIPSWTSLRSMREGESFIPAKRKTITFYLA